MHSVTNHKHCGMNRLGMHVRQAISLIKAGGRQGMLVHMRDNVKYVSGVNLWVFGRPYSSRDCIQDLPVTYYPEESAAALNHDSSCSSLDNTAEAADDEMESSFLENNEKNNEIVTCNALQKAGQVFFSATGPSGVPRTSYSHSTTGYSSENPYKNRSSHYSFNI